MDGLGGRSLWSKIDGIGWDGIGSLDWVWFGWYMLGWLDGIGLGRVGLDWWDGMVRVGLACGGMDGIGIGIIHYTRYTIVT